MMEDEEDIRIMVFLESNYGIDNILNDLNVSEEDLADRIIDLESKELIILENKNWLLTQKGKDSLKKKKEGFKKLKLDHMRGNISRDEFFRRYKELEFIFKSIETVDEPKIDIKNKTRVYTVNATNETVKNEESPSVEEKLICDKCGTENKIGNRFCTKCGQSF